MYMYVYVYIYILYTEDLQNTQYDGSYLKITHLKVMVLLVLEVRESASETKIEVGKSSKARDGSVLPKKVHKGASRQGNNPDSVELHRRPKRPGGSKQENPQ